MAEQQSVASRSRALPLEISGVRAALWLSAPTFLALLVLYVVGLDQGATSVVGGTGHLHEFLHDARHLLGYPCH